ncbi:1-acyl-sn-glycerol-3-phosphate acyltransferase beta-like isoform X2 [Megachile rotundata]|uniref:1-acyl-sn-glycerol-3-phosphate acyltransferase beta-like isoform X2 n=2 Tax=Megachile rotundata TaxID=143995 RepID=UPI000614D163|nr:PREDICTED: 1-acyl-sn-glycerol-3-phosphate acyltransferase alpha-like isoform X1 [Megachile rotundata]
MYNLLQNVVYYSMGFLIVLILLTIVASCETLRYYIKFCSFGAASAIPTSIQWPFMFLRIKDWRNALLSARCLRTCVKLLGVSFHVRGKENIVKDTGSIVLMNHQSILDLTVLAELWPVLERCTVISKKEIFYLGLFGLASWLWGTIFIDRKNSKEAQKGINSTAERIKSIKANVLIFPEGHRHSNSTLLPFKKGAFHLAIESQIPIQPVVISKYYFLNSKLKIFNSGTSYITILPPISTKGLTKEDLPKLIEDTYKIMNNSFMETSQETINEHINTLKDEK